MATLFTDTFTAADNSAWDATKWTTSRNAVTSATTLDILSNQGRMSATTASATSNTVAVDALASTRQDFDMTLRFTTGTTNNAKVMIGVRGIVPSATSTRPSAAMTSGVYVRISNNIAQLAYKVSGGAETNIPNNKTLSTTLWYNLRIRVVGNYAGWKIWDDGTAEPSAWFAEFTTLPALGSGRVFITRENTVASTQSTLLVDDVVVTDGVASFGDIVDVATATLTVQAQDAVQVSPINATVDVPTATMSVASVEPTSVIAQVVTTTAVVATRDYQAAKGTIGGVVDPVQDGTPMEMYPGADYVVLDFQAPIAFSDAGKTAVSLKFNIEAAGGATNYTVRAITAPWDTSTHNGQHAVSATSVVGGSAGTGLKTIDVTSLVTETGFYGLAVYTTAGSGSYMTSSEGSTKPTLTYSYEAVSRSVTLDVPTATATVNAVDAIVEVYNPVNIEVNNPTATLTVAAVEPEISTGATTTLDTPTVSANANEVTVEAQVSPNAEVIVDTPAIVVNAYDAIASISVVVDADSQAPIQVSANDVDVSIEFSAIVVLDTPTIEAQAVRLSEVNGEPVMPTESEDRYFVSTVRTLGGARMDANASFWWRLNETSGNAVHDRASESGHEVSGTYNNVTLGQVDGPDGRANVHFNGDAYIAQDEHGTQETFYQPNSLEFTFRTERATEFIMGGQDQVAEVLATNVTSPYEVWLIDGKLEIRRLSVGFDNTIQATLALPGNTRLDDGKWHHVVFQRAAAGNTENPGSAQFFLFEIYVDGELAMRRRSGFTPYGMPDRIGGRESDWYQAFGTSVAILPKSNWFLGDMTEVIFRNARTLTVDEIHAQRDAVMGILPVYADTARVTLKANDAVVKGNKPRVLVLDFGSRNRFEERTAEFSVPAQARLTRSKMEYATADGVWGNTVPAEFIAWGETGNQYYQSRIGNDYLVTQMSVFGPNPVVSYRDELTDNFRLIDLTRDINMDDYDIISIAGYPRNETMWQTYQGIDDANAAPMIPAKVQLENLMNQIKDQVINHRMSVMITDPFSAIALGIINNAEYVPTFKEVAFLDKRLGAQVGMIDWHAATIDPFNGAQPEIPDALQPDFHDSQKHHQNELAASRYDDTHANIRQRVRYAVEGLTTLVGRKSEWIKVDEIRWWNLNPMSTPPYETSRAYVEKGLGGLDIGDEFYMVGGDGEPLVNTSGARITERDNGWIAAPVSAVKVGHAVTTFASTFQSTIPEAVEASFGKDYDNTVGNPYGDHAVSIAVVPGDVWDGKIVSGKVYVNFTEAFTWWADQQNFDKIMYLTTRGYDDGNSIGIGDEISYASGARWTVTERHLKYQFSTLYGSHQDTQVQLPETRDGGPDWGWSAGGIRDSGNISGGGAQGLVWHWRSAVPLEDIYVPTMANRGVLWLSKDLDISGNATVNVETANLTVSATEATAETQANVVVDVPTARMSAQAFDDTLTPASDITVLVGTADVTVKAVGLVEEIAVETARITLRTSDPEPVAVFVDWSEAFVMVLPRQIETLILEDNN